MTGRGHITETHDPLGRVAQTQWHPVWHQPETEVDAAGNSWCCEYDERGNLLAVTDPLQQNTRYQYDRHGRGADNRCAGGGNKYLQWNEDGQLMRHTDCSGSQTALVLRRTHAADTDDRRAEPQHALRV